MSNLSLKNKSLVLIGGTAGIGLSAAKAMIAAGARVVEDCARGLFGRDASGRLLGSTGDAAIFSPHKTLPVPNGGLVVAPGTDLPTATRAVPEARDLAVSAAISAHRLLGRRPWRPSNPHSPTESFRTLESTGTIDLDAWTWPPAAVGYLSRCGLARTKPQAVQHARRSRYESLRSRLLTVEEVTVRSPEAPPRAAPHGVVVSVDGPTACDAAAAALRGRGLPVERFQWPLTIDAEAVDAFPGARPLRENLLVLPCHQQVPPRAVEPMVDTLRMAVTDQSSTVASVNPS
jgi:dTDP-4-amino-4,6-dideoxygalactose transaminase